MASTKIQVDKKTAAVITELERYGETYDDAIRRLVEEAGYDYEELAEEAGWEDG